MVCFNIIRKIFKTLHRQKMACRYKKYSNVRFLYIHYFLSLYLKKTLDKLNCPNSNKVHQVYKDVLVKYFN